MLVFALVLSGCLSASYSSSSMVLLTPTLLTNNPSWVCLSGSQVVFFVARRYEDIDITVHFHLHFEEEEDKTQLQAWRLFSIFVVVQYSSSFNKILHMPKFALKNFSSIFFWRLKWSEFRWAILSSSHFKSCSIDSWIDSNFKGFSFGKDTLGGTLMSSKLSCQILTLHILKAFLL